MAAEGARDGQNMAGDVRLEGSGHEAVQAQRVRLNTSRATCVASHNGITERFSNEWSIKICAVPSSNLFPAFHVQVQRSEGILLKNVRICDCHRDKGLAGWLVKASPCLSKRTKRRTSLLLLDHRLLRETVSPEVRLAACFFQFKSVQGLEPHLLSFNGSRLLFCQFLP